jgi:WD40 repeat protein
MGSCADGQVNIMERSAWKLMPEPLKLAARPIESMVFDPQQTLWLLLSTCEKHRDNTRVCSELEIRRWNPIQRTFVPEVARVSLPGSETYMLTPGGPTAVTLARDGDFLASAYCFKPEVFRCVQSALQFGPPNSVRKSKPVVGHVSEIGGLAVSSDHKVLVSGSEDGTIAVWRTDGSSILSESISGGADTFFAVAFGDRGPKIAAAGCEEYREEFPRRCQSGALVVVPAKDRNAAALKLPRDVGTLRSLAFSRDGNMLAAGSDTDRLLLWSSLDETPSPEILLSPTQSVLSLQFTSDARALVASGKRGIAIWDVASRKPRQHLARDTKTSILAVAISPDGKTLVSGGEDRAITIWDMHNNSQPKVVAGHTGAVTALRFAAKGTMLASAGEDGIAVWDFPSMQRRSLPFHGHQGPVVTIALSPDGEMLASAGLDRRVLLWDVASGQPLGPALSQDQAWRSLAFSHDGSTLAAVGHGSSIRLFRTSPKLWRELACRRANRNLTQQEWSEYLGTQPPGITCAGSS